MLILAPKLTGSVQKLSFFLDIQISEPPYPPYLLLEKNNNWPSAEIDGCDSQYFVLRDVPILIDSDQTVSFINVEKYKSHPPYVSGLLQEVKNKSLPSKLTDNDPSL